MIKVHFHTLAKPTTIGKVMLCAGTRACHVYSDVGLKELAEWAKRSHVPKEWYHDDDTLKHYDLWGGVMKRLWTTGTVVDNRQFALDLHRIKQECTKKQ